MCHHTSDYLDYRLYVSLRGQFNCHQSASLYLALLHGMFVTAALQHYYCAQLELVDWYTTVYILMCVRCVLRVGPFCNMQ